MFNDGGSGFPLCFYFTEKERTSRAVASGCLDGCK